MRIFFIMGVPRSGTTIATKLLSERPGYLVLPETYLLNALSSKFFKITTESISSCFPDGFPLETVNILDCLTKSDSETNIDKFFCLIEKLYQPDFLVIKSTRLLSYKPRSKRFNINYISIERNELNVYESHSRVDFGVKNRSIIRFCIWFASIQQTILSYRDIERVAYSDLGTFIGDLPHGNGVFPSYIDMYQADKEHHNGLSKPFQPTDEYKLNNLSRVKRLLIPNLLILTKVIPKFIIYIFRRFGDDLLLAKINRGEI